MGSLKAAVFKWLPIPRRWLESSQPKQKVAEISLFCKVFTSVSSQKHNIIEENIPFGSNCPKQD